MCLIGHILAHANYMYMENTSFKKNPQYADTFDEQA